LPESIKQAEMPENGLTLDVSMDEPVIDSELSNIEVIRIQGQYVLPVASQTALGGVKVGTNLMMADEHLSVKTASEPSASDNRPITAAGVKSAMQTLSNTDIEAIINSFV